MFYVFNLDRTIKNNTLIESPINRLNIGGANISIEILKKYRFQADCYEFSLKL
jgi:hypothetical protein